MGTVPIDTFPPTIYDLPGTVSLSDRSLAGHFSMCQWGRFYLTHFRFTMATEQCFLPPHAIAPDQFIVPLQCFQLTHFPTIYERPDTISMPDRSRSGHFAVKNSSREPKPDLRGSASTESVFLMKTTSARAKSDLGNRFSPLIRLLSRDVFHAARSNARAQSGIALAQGRSDMFRCVNWKHRSSCSSLSCSVAIVWGGSAVPWPLYKVRMCQTEPSLLQVADLQRRHTQR